jgi:serine/threonine protein kinase
MMQFKPERHRYHIENTVGEGLSATVYAAIRSDSRSLSRQKVALKILKDKNAVPYLRREFDALSRVNSSHCSRLIAWENSGDDCALVLEWIDGFTLFDLCRNHTFDRELINEVIAQIAKGLQSLSSAGLHHGDLHPKNIMIDRNGRVVLLDFSLQECRAASERRGAIAYLAPEIWNGSQTSLQADIFALGLIALDMASRFANIPATQDSARVRAESLSVEKSTSYFLSSAQRFIPKQTSRKSARNRLSQIVRNEKMARESAAGTAILHILERKLERKLDRKSRSWISVAAIVLTISLLFPVSGVPVRADAPVFESLPTANLIFTSNRWLQVRLNGRDVGFAPLLVGRLNAGSHRLEWKTARGSGTFQLRISPGQTIRFSADDVEHLSHLKH